MDSGYRAGFSVLGDYDMVFFFGHCTILGLWFQTGRPVTSCVITKHMFGLALSYLIPMGLRVLIRWEESEGVDNIGDYVIHCPICSLWELLCNLIWHARFQFPALFCRLQNSTSF